jgi:predicted enzyme related to lactoylglutathione lyase
MTGKVGSIGWTDLTVDNAEEIRNSYSAVVGWKADPIDMGGYNDFNMTPPASGEAVAGVCHARGGNTGLPTQWIMYVTVEDIESSADRCKQLGGKVLTGPTGSAGKDRTCVIQDPAGAVIAPLYQPGK